MGGDATASGTDYQAEAYAYIAAHVLVRHSLDWFDKTQIPIAISPETGGPGDDLRMEMDGGDCLEIQAKRGLKSDAKFYDAVIRILQGLVLAQELKERAQAATAWTVLVRDGLALMRDRGPQQRLSDI